MGFEGKYLKEGIQLFSNQKHNVKCLVHRKRAILSDKVGSGKTLSCLYAFAYLKEKGLVSNMLVLTPLSAYSKEVWKKDIDKFTELKSCSTDELWRLWESGEKIEDLMGRYDVVYGKHTQLKGDMYSMFRKMCKIGCLLVVDEVHAMKNPKAEVSAACKELSRGCDCFWGITGSSISKNLEDLFHIVNLVSPWYLGRFGEFRDEWCIVREKSIGWDAVRRCKKIAKEIVGIKDEEAFRQKMEPLMIVGESFLNLKFHWLDYEMNERESSLYRRIGKGITLEGMSDEEWLRYVLGHEVDEKPRMKDIDAYSSRFIYLQSVVDGTLNDDGTLDGCEGTKIDMLLAKLREICTDKGQSCIVYFDYLTSLEAVKKRIGMDAGIYADVLESSGNHVLKAGEVTEERCAKKPVIILGTRASSESVSYYMINNVVFYDIPSVPHVFVQLVGRITRKNTLYPDDLNVWIFRSDNIDLYKTLLVSAKAYQMELAQGHEGNIPDDYKKMMSKAEMRDIAKKVLLWGDKKVLCDFKGDFS